MINQMLQDVVISGTICPMFGDIFLAACSGKNSVAMAIPPGVDGDAIKARYEALGFTVEKKYDLERGGNVLRVTFAKSLDELQKGEVAK